MKSNLFAVFCALTLSLVGNPAHALEAEISQAVTSEDAGATCRDANLFTTDIITKVCWDCMFPIKVSGFVVSGSKFRDRVPAEASDAQGLCFCFDNLGVPTVGVPSGFWEPYRLAEFVKTPGCSQVLLGKRFPFDKIFRGTSSDTDVAGVAGEKFTNPIDFNHYHYYSFPVASMLSMYMPESCNPGYFNDLDVMYLSEIDPSWNNDEVSFFLNPESALFATPIGPLACIADAFATMVDKTIETLWWCAGSWGQIHNPAGNTGFGSLILNSSSLELTRLLYSAHKRGMEFGTVGDEAACGGTRTTTLPKGQYRFSLFYPVPETDDNHILGRSSIFWGSMKLLYGVSESPVYIVWRWIDCCS